MPPLKKEKRAKMYNLIDYCVTTLLSTQAFHFFFTTWNTFKQINVSVECGKSAKEFFQPAGK